MCYHAKCLLCIPYETGSLVCAIIVAGITGLSLLLSTIAGALTAAGVIGMYYPGLGTAGIFILAVTSLVGLVFAVLLCHGISKRRPEHLKTYFIYGVIVTALAALVSVILLLVGFTTTAVAIILSCVFYSLFLVLVQKTYFNMLETNDDTVLKRNQRIDTQTKPQFSSVGASAPEWGQ